jgi:hypothetical protein
MSEPVSEPANAEGFDENRDLCDDGNCLGVVVDGKCNVCGLAAAAAGTSPRDPGSGQTAAATGTSPRDPGSGQTGGGTISGDASGDMVAEGGHVDDAFDGEERQLCSDGACTGLIGSDGKCKACGRPAAS